MNRIDVKKVMSDFTSLSNRLSQAAYDDYMDVLRKTLNYIDSTELIRGFVVECGGVKEGLEADLDDVITTSHLRFQFSLDDKEEVSEIYTILKIICGREYNHVPLGLLNSYSTASKYADKLKDFNHRVVFILINHIENYLKKVGIEMGIDNNLTYNITGTQVNIANDEATINATQNIGVNAEELQKLISALRSEIREDMPEADKNDVNECVNVIENELLSGDPNEQTVKSQFKILKRIDCGVKFASACCSLLTFADKLYPYLGEVATWFSNIM